jgi:succinyl-diaminopimelate desuccinylase
MKSGVAVLLRWPRWPTRPTTSPLVCYDNEEVEADRNGLGRVARTHPEWLAADLAILLEPTSGRSRRVARGRCGRSHHDRPAGAQRPVLARGQRGARRRPGAGPAGRVRAPLGRHRRLRLPRGPQRGRHRRRRGRQRAAGRVHGRGELPVRAGPLRGRGGRARTVGLRRAGRGGRRGRLGPRGAARAGRAGGREFIAATGTTPVAKYGWTDVSRVRRAGYPGAELRAGDPNLAHTREEHVVLPGSPPARTCCGPTSPGAEPGSPASRGGRGAPADGRTVASGRIRPVPSWP